jgi:hypothetical protein
MKRTALKRGPGPKRRKSPVKARSRKQRLADECGALWSRAVKWDWDYRCAWCGSDGTDAHHLIDCGHHATRYELMNGMCLCRRCHDGIHTNAEMKRRFWAWLVANYPGVVDWVYEHRNDGVTVTEAWLLEQREALRELESGE